MTTARDVFERHRDLFRPVPRLVEGVVCRYCCGAVSGYAQCYSCKELLLGAECPPELRSRIVPMTVVLNPSPWYSVLLNYKRTQWHEYAHVVASLPYLWLQEHRSRIDALLGGPADIVSVVPSKRGVAYDAQPLQRALGIVIPMRERLRQTLECADPAAYHRMKYTPNMFRVAGGIVHDKRIVLVEDTWITGATALSAAGHLIEAGAASVVVVPLAREVKPAFHGADHPYLDLLNEPYSLSDWPR